MSETEFIESSALQGSGSDSRFHRATCEDLLKFAAEDRLGESIELKSHLTTVGNMIMFEHSISIRVLNREENPRAVGKTIVDIYTKEYKNYGDADPKSSNGDTTKAFVQRSSPGSTGRNYKFTSKQGIVWNMHENFGVQLLAIGMGGGTVGLNGDYCENTHMTSQEKAASVLGHTLGFSYSQEENVTIPPGKKVVVAFTTSIIEYQLRYKLEFRLPKMDTIAVKYKKPCLGCLFKVTNYAFIPYWSMVKNLPEYRDDGEYVYFTQEGVLSWFGESCEVNKTEASLV